MRISLLDCLKSDQDELRCQAVVHYYFRGLGDDLAELVSLGKALLESRDLLKAGSLVSVIWHNPDPAFKPIVRAMFNDIPELQFRLVDVMRRLNDVEHLVCLLMNRHEEKIWIGALTALTRLKAPRVVDFLVWHGQRAQGWLGAKSLLLLAQLGHPDGLKLAIQRGIELYQSSECDSQNPMLWAIAWICYDGYPKAQIQTALQPYSSQQKRQLLRCPERLTGRQLATWLVHRGDVQSLSTLSVEDATYLYELALLDHKLALNYAERMLEEDRQCLQALWSIARLSDRAMAENVLEFLIYSERALIRNPLDTKLELQIERGIETLVCCDRQGCTPKLIGYLKSPRPNIRLSAVRAIQHIDDRFCQDALAELLESEDDDAIFLIAARVLTRWGCQAVRDLLFDRLEKDDFDLEGWEMAKYRPLSGPEYLPRIARYLARLDVDAAVKWLETRWLENKDPIYRGELVRLQHPGAVADLFWQITLKPRHPHPALEQLGMLRNAVNEGLSREMLIHQPGYRELKWERLGRLHRDLLLGEIDDGCADRLETLSQLQLDGLTPFLVEWIGDRGLEPISMNSPGDSRTDLRWCAMLALKNVDPGQLRGQESQLFYGALAGGPVHYHLHRFYDQCCGVSKQVSGAYRDVEDRFVTTHGDLLESHRTR